MHIVLDLLPPRQRKSNSINFQQTTASQKAKNMATTVYILLLLLFVSACDALFCQETKLKTRQVEETDECANCQSYFSFFVC